MEFLNYHHLRYFWMVAREGSLRKASERMHVSQPTISAQVAALEDSLGQLLFRRSGRRLALTDAGRRAFGLAEEIFSLGEELVAQVRERDHQRPLPLQLGIADSLPKLISWEIFAPVFKLERPVQLFCREGRTAELLEQLAASVLEVVLSDEPAPSSLPGRLVSHSIGQSATSFFAAPALAKRLRAGFPGSLDGEPVVLPSVSTAWRQEIDGWLYKHAIHPRLVAELDDSALLKIAGTEGLGVIPVPARVENEARERYGLSVVGRAEDCQVRYFAITSQRRSTHPAVSAILQGTTAGP